MSKKIVFIVAGFVAGFLVASLVTLPSARAQMSFERSEFELDTIEPALPASYGKLVAVSGATMYFQGDDGAVYIVKPRTTGTLDTEVRVIERA